MKLNEPQRAAVEACLENNVVVIAGAGSGKCLGYGTRVLMHNGKLRQVQDIQPGDRLMGPDSKPRRVLNVSRGHGKLYQVTPTKGDPWVCNEDHILTISGTGRYKGQVIDVSVADLLKRYSNRADKHWKLLRVGVEFRTRKVPVDPYLVGVWLGDGSRGKAELTNSDPEIIAYCNEVAPDYGCKVKKDWDPRCNTWRHTFILTEAEKGKPGRPVNKLIRFCKRLTDEKGNKFIPLAYRVNSREVRLHVLAGLLDTDGYLYEVGNGYEITSKFKRLAHDIAYLARSLGLAAYIKPKRATIKELGFEGWYWRISISGDTDIIPCKVARKQSRPRSQIKNVLHTGFTLDPLEAGDYYGFTLSGDGRFLLGDFTVTHNTRVLTNAAVHLVNSGVDPKNILLLTFTNRAAGEMRDRATAMLGGEKSTIWASTFHSFGARVLRKSGAWVGLDSDFSIIDDNDSHSILVAARNHLYPSKEVQKGLPQISDITDMISAACSLVVPLPKYVEGLKSLSADAREATIAIYKMYEEHKRKCSQLDFDDLLYYMFRLLGEKEPRQHLRNRFKYVLVDEYQDTNHIQARILYRMIGKHNHFIVVGDDAQCHPPGTMIRVSGDDQVPIETLTDGDRIQGWSRNAQKMISGREIQVASRPFKGRLLRVHVGDRSTEVTPNHKFLCRWTDNTSKGFQVYACNLVPELMSVPLPDGQNRWAPIKEIGYRKYKGLVYSLDVEKDHSYAADDIVVRNCIYTWRYARHTNLFEISERFAGAKLIKMEQNYRSTQAILDLANAFQEQMERQFQKVLWTEQAGGKKPEVRKYDDEITEAQAILQEIRVHQSSGMPLDEIAVLYRTNRCPTYLEIELMRAKVPYQKFGGRNFNEAAHVKDILAHLRAITNPKDAQAMFRSLKLCDKVGIITAQKIIDQPGVKLTERIFSYSDVPNPSLQELRELLGSLEYTKDPAAAVERVVNYYLKLPSVLRAQKNQSKKSTNQFRIETDCQALVAIASSYKDIRGLVNDLTLNSDSDKKKEKKDTLTLSTVHSAKGLEWPVVFIIHAFDGRLPKTNQSGEGDIEEELRVAYVAVTRPHRKLVITYPATIRYYKDRIPTRLCRFLEEAKADLYELQDKTDPYKVYRERQQRQYMNRRRFRW